MMISLAADENAAIRIRHFNRQAEYVEEARRGFPSQGGH